MFDALLGRKFYTKCKTNLKLIKIRMDKITKRRNSVQKFFRADIADLLKNNLDINAYGRAEGLLVEINMSSCYEMIDKFCGCVSSNLSTMDKQTECPDECREALPSLMYAAARFADLPELRHLRNLFSTKYGNSLDLYVSKEFMESLKLKPPTKEMKLQLLQEIAHEASIDWDSKALEQRLYTPPPQQQVSLVPEDDIHKERLCKDDISNTKIDEDIIVTDSLEDHQSENKQPRRHGLVPPPPYYSRVIEAPPASSSDTEDTLDSPTHLQKSSGIGTEKPKPESVRRNRFNKTQSKDNENSSKARTMSDPAIASNARNQEEEDSIIEVTGFVSDKVKSNLQPPPYLRIYGDSSEARSSMVREGKHIRGQSMPQEPTLQGPTRAASLEPNGVKGHIHPNLPNYEDLASRIASLTGR